MKESPHHPTPTQAVETVQQCHSFPVTPALCKRPPKHVSFLPAASWTQDWEVAVLVS